MKHYESRLAVLRGKLLNRDNWYKAAAASSLFLIAPFQTFPTPAPDTSVGVMDVKATAQGLGVWAIAILGLVIALALLVAKRTKRI